MSARDDEEDLTWLAGALIVRAEREDLPIAFAGISGLFGIVDRRKGDRRLQPRSRMPTERRHDDRRIRPWATLALEVQESPAGSDARG